MASKAARETKARQCVEDILGNPDETPVIYKDAVLASALQVIDAGTYNEYASAWVLYDQQTRALPLQERIAMPTVPEFNLDLSQALLAGFLA